MNRTAIVILLMALLVLSAWLVITRNQLPLSLNCVHNMDCTPADKKILEENGGGVIPGTAIWVTEDPEKLQADKKLTDVLLGMIVVCFVSLLSFVLIPDISTRR